MAVTPRHQFQVLTKRPERMRAFFDWLDQHEQSPVALCTQAAATAMNQTLSVGHDVPWPLSNVWLGTSVEDERVADRIEALQSVPAQVRFLSCEPLIGAVDVVGRLADIHWVIVGGESGSGARPMRPEWVKAIQSACREQGAAYFFKQTGAVLAKEWG